MLSNKLNKNLINIIHQYLILSVNDSNRIKKLLIFNLEIQIKKFIAIHLLLFITVKFVIKKIFVILFPFIKSKS